jgi:hypothetical protein
MALICGVLRVRGRSMKSFIMQEIDVGFSGRDETQVDPEKQVDPSSVPLE